MTPELPLPIATIDNVTLSVFMTMFGLSGELLSESETGDQEHSPLFNAISIRGEWSGRVWVGAPRQLLSQILELVHEIEPEEISESCIQDTLAELTNMIGGGIKALLPGSCELSLPEEAQSPSGPYRCYNVDGHEITVWFTEPKGCSVDPAELAA